MTHRLYYTDATQRKFTARVVEARYVGSQDGSQYPAVRLDRTAFYPTSGGQPHDTGKLNGTRVIDVWDDEAGNIWHVLEKSLEDTSVRGEIDWPRRFDHMQQHTGQHLLSAAFVDTLNAATIGFHLGSTSSTIDLNLSHLTWDAATRVEETVNAIVFENRPVTVHIVSQEELSDIPLRKPPQVTGKIRVIWVEGYDASACGGTHVEHTGQIGLIKITGIERYKGGTRVIFLCGQRALRDYTRVLNILRAASNELTVGQDEVYDAVTRNRDEVKIMRRTLSKVQSELVYYEAAQLWAETPEVRGIRFITMHWIDRTFENVRAMASQLRERPHTLLLLAATEEKGVRLVCARSDDLPEIDAADLLRAAAGALGGQGGGSPTIAQGGAQPAPHSVIMETLRQVMEKVKLSDLQIKTV